MCVTMKYEKFYVENWTETSEDFSVHPRRHQHAQHVIFVQINGAILPIAEVILLH